MDIQVMVEAESFLKCLGAPFKSFCVCWTLKHGVYLLAGMDFLWGICKALWLILFIPVFITSGYQEFYSYYQITIACFDIAGILFGYHGVKGMMKINIEQLTWYYHFRLFIFFQTQLFLLLEFFTVNLSLNSLLFISVYFILSALVTKSIWSTVIRLEYNETVLVMHGEAVLNMMKQKAINLANPDIHISK